MTSVPLWHRQPDGAIATGRRAEFWRASKGGAIDCQLCYRQCHLEPNAKGWCGFRGNAPEGSRMELYDHGVITSLVRQIRGYQVDPFLTFMPGATSLFFGGVRCTSSCTFCMSEAIVHAPQNVPWLVEPSNLIPSDSLLYAQRAMMHPLDAIEAAKHHGVRQIEFGINEPLLSWESTYDTARLAKEAGLEVCVESNGFSTPAAIRKLAPYVDAVDLSPKGSADADFYRTYMHADGALPAVMRSLVEWRKAGVHVIVGDLLAPPFMQDDASFERSARDFYRHIRTDLGPITDVLTTLIFETGPQVVGEVGVLMVGPRPGPNATQEYRRRGDRALEIAHAEGLPYAHGKDYEPIRCHACDGLLLRFNEVCSGAPEVPCVMARFFCNWWTHEQHVINGRCEHCGTAVPIVALSEHDLAIERAKVQSSTSQAGLKAPHPASLDANVKEMLIRG